MSDIVNEVVVTEDELIIALDEFTAAVLEGLKATGVKSFRKYYRES